MSSPDLVRGIACDLAAAQECTTGGRPTFRAGQTMFAARHDDLVILRGERETQAAGLAQDSRLWPALYWGRDGWIAIPRGDVSDEQLPDLFSDTAELAGRATR
jgi:hypothetical protein